MYITQSDVLHADNDNFWQLAHGHLMLKNGLYTEEPLSMHEGLKFVYPQWLSILIFTIIYDLAGVVGVDVWYKLIQIIGLFFVYKLVKLLTDNDYISVVLTCMFLLVYSTGLYATRPFVISQTLVAAEIYLLEKYIRTNNEKILIWLPILSVMWINLHNSLWLFLYILALPMIAEYLYCIWKKKDRPFNMQPLIVSLAASSMTAMINPYGAEYIMYLPSSAAAVAISSIYIIELKESTVSGYGICVFLIMAVLAASVMYLFWKRFECENPEEEREYRNVIAPIRYWLLFGGTLVLALLHVRNITIFVIGSAPLIAYYTSQFSPIPKDGSIGHIFKKSLVIYLIVFTVICVRGTATAGNEIVATDDEKDAITFMEENVSKDKTVFSAINSGGMLELCGYKTFIDTRLEVFTKALNGKQDYLTEYWNIQNGNLWPGDFLEDYDFDIFYMRKTYLPTMENYLANADGYNVIFEDDAVIIYEAEK